MASEAEIAWAAGLFEGEGHFSVKHLGAGYRARFIMGVTSTDRDVVERFASIAECGFVNQKPRLRNGKPHWKQQYAWACGSTAAVEFAQRLLPYLGERRSARFAEIMEFIDATQPKPRACECCSQEFSPTRFDRERFCSDRCRDRAKYLRRKYGVTSEAAFAQIGSAS